MHQTITPLKTTMTTTMTLSDREFVNSLFDELLTHTDTEMIDLHDDDSCCDELEFKRLEID